MNRFQAALKAFRMPALVKSASPQKSYTHNLHDLMGRAGTHDGQLAATAWGATLAYYKIPAVKSAVDAIAENAASVPIVELDAHGNEVARSDKNPQDSPLITAILAAYQYHGVPLIQEWVSARLLYGMNFIQLVPNPYGYVRGLRWLNPNSVQINAPYGEIESFYYGVRAENVPHTLPVSQVLYSRGFNPGDDVYGFSSTLNVMSKVNITLDFDRFTIAYHRNAGQLGMAVSFKESTDIKQAEALAEFWRRTFRGVDSFFKTQISHIPLEYQQFEPIDLSKPLEVSKDAERAILMGYRVPPEMLGDTQNNPYQFSAEKKNAFMRTVVKPHLDAVANALKTKALQYFAPEGHQIVFDFDEFRSLSDTDEKREGIALQAYNSGAITLNQYLTETKRESVEHGNVYKVLAGTIFIPAGTLGSEPAPVSVPVAEVPALPSAPAKRLKIDSVDRAAYAYIPLASNIDILRIQRELKRVLPDSRIKWELAPTLHVTLCYAGAFPDSALDSLTAAIPLSVMQLQPKLMDPIAWFETPDGKALHIALERDDILDAVQSAVYKAFKANGRELSAFSDPADWKPHITMAYVPNDVEIPDFSTNGAYPGFLIAADSIVIARDDYDPVLILNAPKRVKSKAAFVDASDPLSDDLKMWQRVALRRYKSSSIAKALDFTSDAIPSILQAAIRGALAAVQTTDEIYTVFDDADNWVKNYA